jgi:predicted amidohydrolase
MTSKGRVERVISLLFETSSDYDENLQTLLTLIDKAPKNSLIVAPEVALTGYDYDNFSQAVAFAREAIEALKRVSSDKIIILTLLEERDGEVYNFAKVFYNGEVVYERAKAKLFRFGDEHKYLSEGSDDNFEIVEVAGVKIAIFICFELRFKELWQLAEGSDVIAVPAWWGLLRSENFKLLTAALAVMNQCYVVASDSQNEECTKMSGIITPEGEVFRNETRASLELPYERKKIELMRRYMDVGISIA